MKTQFQIAGGSVTGNEHRLIGKNNQDSFGWIQQEPFSVALVCDGCSSGTHSEIGAQIGCRLLLHEFQERLRQGPVLNAEIIPGWLDRVRQSVLGQLRELTQSMSGPFALTVADYFLFTTLGIIITTESVCTFSIGDGMIILNGTYHQIGPFPHNEPPYLGYGLLDQTQTSISPELLKFQIHHHLPTKSVNSVLIGTDGLHDLAQSEDSDALCQFWVDDRFFHNPDQIRRHLFLLNRETIRPDWQRRQLIKSPGCLPDDTTLIVIRRHQTPVRVQRDAA